MKNDVVKKDLYSAYTKDIEDKTPDITNLATKTTLNSEINEVNGEITNITNLDTTSSLTAVENVIPSVSNLVKKIDFNTKNNDTNKKLTDHTHDKYITTPEFITFTAEVFDWRLKQGNLARKIDISALANKTDFDNKLKDLMTIKIDLINYEKKLRQYQQKDKQKSW